MADTTWKLMLDTRKNCEKNDGTYPLKIRLRHKGANYPIALGDDYSVSKSGWNNNKKEIRLSAKNGAVLIARCKVKLSIIGDFIKALNGQHLNLSAKDLGAMCKKALKEKVDGPTKYDVIEDENGGGGTIENPIVDLDVGEGDQKSMTLWSWAETLAARKRALKKFGTAGNYIDNSRSVIEYHGSEDLQLTQITKTFLEEYKVWYIQKQKKKGNTGSGLETKLRAIRAILNKAVDEEIILPAQNPFTKLPGRKPVEIPKANPKKRATNPEVFFDFARLFRGERINDVQLEPGTADFHVVAEAVFMWECLAMNFIDLVKLKVCEVETDVIRYNRSKTEGLVHFAQSEISKEIVTYYSKDKRPDDFLFRYGWSDDKAGWHTYKTRLRRFTLRITRIANEIGYEGIVSSYVLRHTFATTLRRNGVSRDDISEMYGHKDGRSIDVYVDKSDPVKLTSKAREALSLARGQ